MKSQEKTAPKTSQGIQGDGGGGGGEGRGGTA